MPSKHPQEVCGQVNALYRYTRETSPSDRFFALSLTPIYSPFTESRHSPFSMGKIAPFGSIRAAARPSNQLIAPQFAYRCGVTMQTWLGANDWQRAHP